MSFDKIRFFIQGVIYFNVLLRNEAESVIQLQDSVLSKDMQAFILRVVKEYHSEKTGIEIVHVNYVNKDYLDYTLKLITVNSSFVIWNLDILNGQYDISNNSFLITFANPAETIVDAAFLYKNIRTKRQKSIIILTGHVHMFIISSYIQSFWQLKMLNGIVVAEQNTGLQMYTPNPYSSSDTIVENMTETVYNKKLFYDKTKNLQKFPIRILLQYDDSPSAYVTYDSNGNRKITGKDFNTVTSIFEKLNATLEIIVCDDVLGENETNPFFNIIAFENKSETEHKILIDNKIDMLMLATPFDIHEYYENSYPHKDDGLGVIVPKACEYLLYENVISAFSVDFYVFIAIAPLAFSMLYSIMQRFHLKQPTSMSSLITNFYRPFITNALPLETRNPVIRSFVGGWWIICMIINLAAISKITSLITTTTYREDINTVEKLMESNLNIYAFETFIKNIKKQYDGTRYESFVNSIIPLRMEGESTYEQIISFINNLPENECFIFQRYVAKLITQMRMLRRNGRPLFHLMQQSILPYLESYQFISGSPLIPSFNKVLSGLQEGGLMKLWNEQEVFVLIILGFIYPNEDYDDSQHMPEAMKFNVMKPFLYPLMMGYTIAIGIFISELLFQRMLRHRNKNSYVEK